MIKIPAYFSGYSSRSDNSLGLRFATQEESSQTVAELQKLNGAFGWLLFSENQVDDAEIPTEDVEDKTKTPSKRLRAVLFKLWKQSGEGDFEVWYRAKMEKIIEAYKGKLDV